MAHQKDEAYSTFLKKLKSVTVDETAATDGVTTALASLAYDLPEYELESIEALSQQFNRAEHWSDLPTIPTKLVDNVVSIACTDVAEATKLEKGCLHFSNLCHHLLVKLCLLSIDSLKTGAKGEKAAVVSVLTSVDHWRAEFSSVADATPDVTVNCETVDPRSLEHCTAAKEDDDDFIFESLEEPAADSPAGNVHSIGAGRSGTGDADEIAAAYITYCNSAMQSDSLFMLPGSIWFSEQGLENTGRLAKEFWLLSTAGKHSSLSVLGHQYLSLLLRMIEFFPADCTDAVVAVSKVLSSPVPAECFSLLITRFALLPLSDMNGPSRREVLRLYSEHLNQGVASGLATLLADAGRRDGSTTAAADSHLASLCGCAELAVLWGSRQLADCLLSTGVWRDLCRLASASECARHPRHVVLAGCCRFDKLFDFAFRVPSLVATLPAPPCGDGGMTGVEDFLWILLRSHGNEYAARAAQRDVLRSYLIAAVDRLTDSLRADDGAFAEWCLVSQLLEALVTVREPLRDFLRPCLAQLKARVWPLMLAGGGGSVGTAVATVEDDATVTPAVSTHIHAEAAVSSVRNAVDGGDDDDREKSAKSLKPKWHQCRSSVLMNLKRLLSDDRGKCD